MPSLLKMMAEMGLNITPFQKGLQEAKQSAATQGNNIGQAFSSTIKRYFGVAALTAFGASIVHRIGEIKDLADQFNLTTDEVQKFGAAFENSGLQAADAGSAIDRLNKARKEAVENSQDLRDSFAAFGISVEQLNDASLNTKDIFRQIGIALREGQVGDKERAALMDLMGKNGARFVAAMKELQTVKPSIIEDEHIERIDKAAKHLKGLRRELEEFLAVHTSELLKGDIPGAIEHAVDAVDKKTGLKLQHPALELLRLLRDAFGGKGEFTVAPGFDPKAAARRIAGGGLSDGGAPSRGAMLGRQKQQLFEDGIAAKQRLITGKAQAEVEEKMSEIVFGKLDRESQISTLRKKQRDLEGEIAYQKKQQVNELYTEEVRQENIANLKKEQLEAEQKILALQKQGAIGFQGFRELAQVGGLNPANYAPLPQRGRTQPAESGKTIAILGEIENQLKNKKVILGR